MKTKIVRTGNGWYIPGLPGFDDIREHTVAVSVGLESVNSFTDLLASL